MVDPESKEAIVMDIVSITWTILLVFIYTSHLFFNSNIFEDFAVRVLSMVSVLYFLFEIYFRFH